MQPQVLCLLQADLELSILLTPFSSSWDGKCVPPGPAEFHSFQSPDCAGHLSGFRNTSFLFLKLDENSHPCLHENSGSDLTSGPGLLAPPTSLFLPW